MKAFENKTNNGKEKAIKKGQKLPEGAVNLGWYSSDGVSPSNQINLVNSSGLIPENVVNSYLMESDSIMYSDEFGVLRYAESDPIKQQYKHSPIISNSEISVSNHIINNSIESSLNYSGRISDFGSKNFVHSYYVSSHFTVQSPLISNYSGIETTSAIRNPDSMGIKVVDDSGNKYIDENGNNNYEIYLDRYLPIADSPTSNGVFYRIIVTLPDHNPSNLNLIYDKFELTSSGLSKNQFLGYKEKINAVPYYEQVAEEAEVVDFSSLDRRIYSTQLFSSKENALLKNKTDQFGWKAFVPNKAVQDIRTFQTFNWRLAAKITYNYSNIRNIYSSQERPKIRCAVIVSGENNISYPYVFHNISNYPFNVNNFDFENPLATTENKSSKEYWVVDISNPDLLAQNYDIVYWAPSSRITDIQANKILELSRKNTSIFIDTSLLPTYPINSGLVSLGFSFSSKYVTTGLIKLRQEYIDGKQTFYGWNLNDFNESSAVLSYGIVGYRKNFFNSSTLPVKVFDTSSNFSSLKNSPIATIDNDTLILKKTFNSYVEFESQKPAIYFCSYNISSYLNDYYGTSGLEGKTNNSDLNRIDFSVSQLNPIIEGPCKIFYNVISESLANKVASSRTVVEGSSLVWHVSPWRNSWTINGKRTDGLVTVLSDEEKLAYGFSDKIPSTTDANGAEVEKKFVRQLSVDNSSLITEIFKKDFMESSNQDASVINRDYSNVEFYIECTNGNVGFLNFDEISSSEYIYGQSSAYKTYKLSSAAKSQITNLSPTTIDAFSKIESPEIDFSTIRYPYILVDESEYTTQTNNNIKIPKSYLPGAQQTKEYSFDLAVQYSYRKVSELNSNYSVEWEVPFSTSVVGSGSFTGLFPVTVDAFSPDTVSIAELEDDPITIVDADSRFNGYKYSSKIYSRTDILAPDIDQTNNVQNNFHYTNDIARSERWDEYRLIYVNSSDSTTSATTATTSRSSSNPQWSGPYGYISRRYKKGEKLAFAGSTSHSGYGILKSSNAWSKTVFYDSTENVIQFGALFEKWLWPFATAKAPSSIREYVANAKESFLVNEFKKVYSNIYEANIEVVPIDFTSAKTNVEVAKTVTPTSSNPTKIAAIQNEYVKYIQYTLNQNGFSLAVDGRYGRKTAQAVYQFQTNNSLGFIDGIVDSQTKSVLAIYWLNLKRTNPLVFLSKRNTAPDNDIKIYIDEAVKYSDISNIGKAGQEYRRISFTGVPGPDKIVDYIIIKVPDNAYQLSGIKFTSGAWNTIIKHVWVYDQDLVTTKHLIPDYKNSSIKSVANKVVDVNVRANSSYTIPIANRQNMKYVMLKLEGDRVSGLGPNAEGFSIKNIEFNILTKEPKTSYENRTYSGTFSGQASGKIKGQNTIPAGEYVPIDLKHSLGTLTGINYITEIYLDNIFVDTETVENFAIQNGSIVISEYNSSNPFVLKYSNGNLNNNTIDYNSGGVQFSLRPENSNVISISVAPTITSATKLSSPPQSQLTSNFKIVAPSTNNSDAKFVLSSNLSQEFISEQSTGIVGVGSYRIKDADDEFKQVRSVPSTVSAKDGIVVLCKEDSLLPVGFPNFASIINSAPNTDISFGFINLIWNSTDPVPHGLRWEFYNLSTKKFYGNKISYYDYMKDGPNNIYIGLLAYDNDGDSATKNIIGGDSHQISVSQLPNKIIAPIYSVKVSSRNKISVSPPPSDLSKFDSWFIQVSPGKFHKEITVPEISYSNFLLKHRGNKLRCLYDTTKMNNNVSNIFGTGYYDVVGENPIIVSDNQVRVRHGSFCVYQNQINKLGFNKKLTDANPIIPAVSIRIRDSKDSNWRQIDKNEILSFDKNIGTIIFKKEIVPSNPQNIEVTYTVKNINYLIRHINGSEIPLNPFNSNINSFKKPIYIYTLPTYVEYMENGFFIEESEYTNQQPIYWTYDSGIFDSSKDTYNPLALMLATVNVINKYSFDNIRFTDLRVKGGGISGVVNPTTLAESNKDILSFADVISNRGYVYPNGGYVIVRLPKEVKDYFTSEEDLYSIIRSNLTAGVSFDVQDLEGNDWRTI